jgi:hypothetical protein
VYFDILHVNSIPYHKGNVFLFFVLLKKTLDKYWESACWCFALETGSRAFTAANICFKDITRISKHEDKYKVYINARFQKGNHKSPHEVCLEGTSKKKDGENFIYWYVLYQLLKKKLFFFFQVQ